jgi:hypothetical protein
VALGLREGVTETLGFRWSLTYGDARVLAYGGGAPPHGGGRNRGRSRHGGMVGEHASSRDEVRVCKVEAGAEELGTRDGGWQRRQEAKIWAALRGRLQTGEGLRKI